MEVPDQITAISTLTVLIQRRDYHCENPYDYCFYDCFHLFIHLSHTHPFYAASADFVLARAAITFL